MQKNKRGFTLIELMMVVAVIAILASVVLISLNSAREKAALNKYTSYGVQMYRLVGDAVAAGYLDIGVLIRSGVSRADMEAGSYCLGAYTVGCGPGGVQISKGASGAPGAVYAALTKLSDFPDEVEYSPYSAGTDGVTVSFDYGARSTATIYMYLLTDTDTAYLIKVCNSINWKADTANGYCYIDVPLSSRMSS